MCHASSLIDASSSEPISLSTRKPSWSRVRVSEHDDCQLIYQLLEATYGQTPILNNVREAVIKLGGIREGCFFPTYNEHSKRYEEREQLRSVDAAHPILDTVRILGLDSEQPEHPVSGHELFKQLTWHEPEIRAERETHLAEDPERWHVQSYTGLRDAEFKHAAAPLLLMHCPNIENLTYSVCPMNYNRDPQAPYTAHPLERTLLRNNYGKLPQMHLQRLRHVRLLPEAGLWWDDRRTYSHMDILGQMRLFHRLPAIESIAIDGITINGGADYLEHIPPHTSVIKSIHVGHSMLPSSLIAPLIRMPKQLEEFSHSVGGRDSRDGGHYMFSTKTLGKALWAQRASLRKLDIDVDDLLLDDKYDKYAEEDYEEYREEVTGSDKPYWYDEWFELDERDSTGPLHVHDLPDTREYTNTIGSLHDFENLTDLRIGIKLLLGPPESKTPFRLVEALPRKLDFLLLRGYTRSQVAKYDEAIDELLALRHEQLPALKEIRGVEECIPSAKVERARRRRWGEDEEEEEEVQYWELEEGDQHWA